VCQVVRGEHESSAEIFDHCRIPASGLQYYFCSDCSRHRQCLCPIGGLFFGSNVEQRPDVLEKAAEGGMAEVEFGKLAERNAQSQEVKDFGKRMVDDHSKANDELNQIASQAGAALPTGLSTSDNTTKEHLSKMQGDAFDKAYVRHMVADHQQDVSEFKQETTAGKDPQL
jgi:predicted outer membrane protein